MINIEAALAAEHLFFLPRSPEHFFLHSVAPELDHDRSRLCLRAVGLRCQRSVCLLNSKVPVTGEVELMFQ